MSSTLSRNSIGSYRRIFLAVILCLMALALANFHYLGFTGSAAPNTSPPQKPAKPKAPEVKASAAAAEQLARVQQTASTQVRSHVARETGHYDFVRAVDGGVLVVDSSGDKPESRAMAFLREHGALIGMSATERSLAGEKAGSDVSASTFKAAGVSSDSMGSHVRLNQFYRGLPVFGAQIVVHMNDRGITAVSGHFVPDIKISSTPKLSDAKARAAALNYTGPSVGVVKSELSIYRQGLLEGYQGQSVLAYNIEVSDGKAARFQIWVDAIKGVVLNSIALNHAALNRTIFTPEHDPMFAVRHEGDPLTPGATPGTTGADPINNLYVMAGHTYNLYSSGFGRDSYDGMGIGMDSVYLINDICPNAYWNGLSTNYCPDFDSDDVVAHEWGHAYTQYTHNLIYSYQSGALNESYSDIFGETVDLLNGVDAEGGSNNSQPMPAGQRWQMGEDVPTLNAQQLGILRDMWTPTRYGDPDMVSSPRYACGSGDGGGVHTNSGVPNHAYAMLVDGKTFNGQTVAAIGFVRALHIYYRAMTVYQTPTTNFAQHAEALRASCSDLIGQPLNALSTSSATGSVSPDVITATTCQQIDKAMLAVEMEDPVPCNLLPILDPDTPESCDGATTIFSEDWETGDDGWTRTSTGVFADWEDSSRHLRDFTLDSSLPADRTGTAAYARNIGLGEPGGGTCAPGGDYSGQYTIDSPNILIPANAEELRLNFDHYVATEATFDGGQLEISVNGGAFELVPQSAYIHNAPNAPFEAAPPVGLNTNPNAGEDAWHGTNTGTQVGSWGTTIVDLSSLANPGDQIKLRFNFSQDGCNGVDGWYVDNINLYYCPPLEAPVLSLGGDYENPDTNGSYTLNWVRPSGASGPDVLQQSTVCAPLMSDDAESGLGQWTAVSSELIAPMWQTSSAKPNHSSTAFWANPVSEQETQNSNATLTFNAPIAIPSSGITTLNFSEWYVNESDDHGYVDISTDGGTTWVPIFDNNRNLLTEDGLLAFAEEELKPRQLDLTVYSGQTIRLRFRFVLGTSNFFLNTQFGWYIDDISIVNDSFTDVTTTAGVSHMVNGLSNGTRCYRVRTTYTFGALVVRGPYSNVVTAVTQLTGTPLPDIDPLSSSLVSESCPSSNGQVDPGERVTMNLQLINNGNAGTSNLVATLQSSANVIAPSGPQSYGALAPGGSATRAFTFTADGSSGQSIPVTLSLQDGAMNLGTATFNITLGNNTACRIPRLVISSTMFRDNATTVRANYTVQNVGAVAANNTQLTNARLGVTPGTPLPQNLGNIAPGATTSPMDVFFTNASPGSSANLTLEGTYTGGSFSSTKRVTIP